MKLYSHQLKIIEEDKKKCGLFLGTGSGKSLIALSLVQVKTLIICPKTLRDGKTWESNLEKLNKNISITVISKEEFRRDWETLPYYNSIIIDESHTVSGISPTICYKNKKPYPKSSQLFDACKGYLSKYPPERLYLLTATPIRNPMAVYATGLLLGKDWNFYDFRDIYYVPIKMGTHREIWMPKKDKQTQERLGQTVQKLGYTGKLDDWFDVPEQTHIVKNIPLNKEQVAKLKELPLEYPDPLVLTGKLHQLEQGVLKGNEFEKSRLFFSWKVDAIEDLYEEFGKILVFAKYTEQIEMLEKYFNNLGVSVYKLTGQTTNRGDVLKQAELDNRCIVIAQSSVSAGYELPSFRCTIFASMSYSYVDYSQALGRTLRANNLQKNLYVYLISGKIDKAVYSSIQNKEDFNEMIYCKVI